MQEDDDVVVLSYDTWRRRRMCTRKTQVFDRRLDANRAVLNAWRRGLNVWPYLCEYCGKYHLTHQRPVVK